MLYVFFEIDEKVKVGAEVNIVHCAMAYRTGYNNDYVTKIVEPRIVLVIRPGQSPIAVGGTWWEPIVGGAVAGWNDDSPVHTRRTIARATVQQMTAPAVTETFETVYETFSNQYTVR